jgi:hypothetical protein
MLRVPNPPPAVGGGWDRNREEDSLGHRLLRFATANIYESQWL